MTVNLRQLIPEKFFQNSDILSTFVTTFNDIVDEWNVKIAGIQQLQDPYNVPAAYLQYLADQIGFILSSSDDVSTAVRRRELLGAIDWYKIKGTYKSLNLISLWADFNFTIYDKYCNSEANYNTGTFSDQEWFVGDENENPTGLDSTYFKTPHFGLNVDLDIIYDAGDYIEGTLEKHLWRPSLFVGVAAHVEKTRPVNTVPAYVILHTCVTDESLEAYTMTDTETVTRIVGVWFPSRLFFDEEPSASKVYFDNSDDFDYSAGDFLDSITVWKLSTSTVVESGDSGEDTQMNLDDDPSSGFSLEEVVLSGTVDGYTEFDDRIEFYFTVPKSTVQYDINELGLYRVVNDVEELMIASTFWKINKGSDTALKVKVIVYRTLGL